MWLLLVDGLNVLFSKLSVMFWKLTIFKLEVISIFNPSSLNELVIPLGGTWEIDEKIKQFRKNDTEIKPKTY